MLREEGDAEFDAADVNGSESDLTKIKSVEVNEPGTSRGWGCGHGRKMRCDSGCDGSCGCGGGRGRGQQAQGAISEEQVCGNYTFMLLMLLCDSVLSAAA